MMHKRARVTDIKKTSTAVCSNICERCTCKYHILGEPKPNVGLVQKEFESLENEIEIALDNSISIDIPLLKTQNWHQRFYEVQHATHEKYVEKHLQNWSLDVLDRRRVLLLECRVALLGCLVRLDFPIEIRCHIMMYTRGDDDNIEKLRRYLVVVLSGFRSAIDHNKRLKI